jgi:23S rRNA pseudouridine2605 synthase
MKTRLQKYIADAGIASRRKAENFIVEGKIKVNGKIVRELGVKVDDNDKIYFDNKLIKKQSEKIYIMMNKPVGVLCTVKKGREKGRIITDLIKIKERIYPVGRLDKNSSGLIILTNDGELALKITHPKYEKEKEYLVTVDGNIENDLVTGFEKGIVLDGKKTQPAKIKIKNKNTFLVILKEGRKRQIRRVCQKYNYNVRSLHRIRINKLKLNNLSIGKWRFMTNDDLKKII